MHQRNVVNAILLKNVKHATSAMPASPPPLPPSMAASTIWENVFKESNSIYVNIGRIATHYESHFECAMQLEMDAFCIDSGDENNNERIT